MTTPGLITLVMTHTEEVGATDAENATLRERLLARAQEVCDRVWGFDPNWDFKLTSDTVTITAGTALLPVNFGDWGDHGGVFIPAAKRKLRYLEPPELIALVNLSPSNNTYPEFYTDFGISETGSTDLYRRVMTVYPTADTTATVYYNRITPTLTDGTTDIDGLQFFPAQFHYVILKGVQWLCGIDRGDGRADEMDAWFEREMKRMKAHHVFGRNQDQTLSQYGGLPAHRSW